MRIIIDGDACPSIPFIESLGEKYNLKVIIFCDINHYIHSDYAEVKVVDCGFQSVDMYVINEVKEHDIVVTQDYGVAALCLPKKTKVINPSGMVYTDSNIDRLLEDRHRSEVLRKAGAKTKNQRKRNKKDELKFLNSLEKLILDSIKDC